MRLITFSFSHYCEKARWAADHLGVAYREAAYPPGLHVPVVRRYGGRTVPVLVAPDRTLVDSTDILKYLDAHARAERALFPADPAARREVEALEDWLDAELGPAARSWAFYHLLPHPRRMVALASARVGRGERLLLRLMAPVAAPVYRDRYGISKATADEALETLARVFDQIGAILADGRTFLVGEHLTAADITFAALAAPVLMPPGHPVHAAEPEALPPAMAPLVASLRATPAGAFALRLYREHRAPRA